MKKRYIFTLIVIVLVILIILLSNNQKKELNYFLTCSSPNTYNNYQEILKYKFRNKELYSFYREEIFTPKNKSIKSKTIMYFNDTLKTLTLDDDFNYSMEEKDDKIYIRTYIEVKNKPDLFEEYMIDQQLKKDAKISQIKYVLEKHKYECEVTTE